MRTKGSGVPEIKEHSPRECFELKFRVNWRYKRQLLEATHRTASSLALRLTKATLLINFFISVFAVNARRVWNVGFPFSLMCGDWLLSTHLPWPDNGSPTSNRISGD